MSHITCYGFELFGVQIPHFEVNNNESVCMQWPVGPSHPAVTSFKDLLLRKDQSERLLVDGGVCLCEPIGVLVRALGSRPLASILLRIASRRIIDWLYAKNIITEELNFQGKLIPANAKRNLILPFLESGKLMAAQQSHRKLLAFLFCLECNDIILFDQQGCTPGRLINFLETVASDVITLEFRFSDNQIELGKTYRNAPILKLELISHNVE